MTRVETASAFELSRGDLKAPERHRLVPFGGDYGSVSEKITHLRQGDAQLD
jgi:hypothetical protein